MAYEAVYDRSEVADIAARVKTTEYKGMPLELRPVPGTDATDELDPRVLADALAKMAGTVANIPMENFTAMRKRPLKETHPLIQGKVERSVKLMDLGDRSIVLHVWTPENHVAPSPVLYFCHGGGWAFGDVEAYANFLALIAEETGAVVAYPEYRFAPETPFPGGLMDCSQGVDWMAAHQEELGIDISRLAVSGDSAGGSLINGVIQMQAARHPVKLQVNIYGGMDAGPIPEDWSYDFHPVRADQADAARNRIDRTKGLGVSLFYTHGDTEALKDPLISANYCGSFECFPRSVVVASAYDFLKYQDLEFAHKLWVAGRDVRAVLYLGMDHGFIERSGVYPQAEDLARLVAAEMNDMFAE